MTDFLKEAYVMHKLRHDRLVKLIGFCINRESSVCSVYVVMEKMSKGALKDLLLKDQGKEIKFSHLMTMAKQVCLAIEFRPRNSIKIKRIMKYIYIYNFTIRLA